MQINLTLIGQMITFILLVVLTMKYIWPPIMKALHDREQKIGDGLAAAEQGQRSLELAHRQVEEMLRDAKIQVAEMLDQANKRAADIVDEGREVARKEAGQIIAASAAETERQMQRARTQLKTETAQLAVAIAGKIIGKRMDAQGHDLLLNELVDEMSN